MFSKKKKKTLDSLPLSSINYVEGAQPYQGADEVLLCILAFSFARMVVDKVPQKKLTPHMSVLYKRWGDLIDKNAEWLAAMEVAQEVSGAMEAAQEGSDAD